ncbi:MAG: carotenoid oxygenase, partial [Chromatiales bacterium]|nr:carotenoid oxygenase [Chromatiales bacterium]
HHWFVGNGMVHGLQLREGKVGWFRNRYVRSPATYQALGETPIDNPFDEGRVFAANTNVIGHAGRTYALVEGGACPIELSYELETVAYSDFGGTLPRGFSAHPKRDPRSGELHTVAYYWGWGNQVQYVCVGPDGTVTRTENIATHGGPMIHDVAFTENYVVVMDLPCAFDPVAAKAGVSLPYRWQEDYPARVGLLRRDGAGEIIWVDIEPCYIFHPLNAYEDAVGDVILDAVRHPKMFAAKDVVGPNDGPPTLDRWVISPRFRTAGRSTIDDRPQEFPRHDERQEGAYSRYSYTTELNPRSDDEGLIKTDLKTGERVVHSAPGRHHMEGVFVPRSSASGEDDGWVMAFAWDQASNDGVVVILDAGDFANTPVATIHLPQRVPFGFHGNWIAD